MEIDLQKTLIKAFKAITQPEEYIYAFDWQHSSFKFNPRSTGTSNWKIPAFPDGDYYIFLTQDAKSGIFGHPWEKTMCVFGSDLLQELKKYSDN